MLYSFLIEKQRYGYEINANVNGMHICHFLKQNILIE